MFTFHVHVYCNWYVLNSQITDFLSSFLHLIGRIPLSSSYDDVRREPKYIVFLSKLLLLFQFCHVCGTGSKPEITAEETGTGVVIKTVCNNSNCRKEFTWTSQPFMPSTKMLAGNLLISMGCAICWGFFYKSKTNLLAHGSGLYFIEHILQAPTGKWTRLILSRDRHLTAAYHESWRQLEQAISSDGICFKLSYEVIHTIL